MPVNTPNPHRKVTVVDTSPLLTLLGLHFIRKSPGESPNFNRIITGRANEYLKDKPDTQEAFRLFFENLPCILTTSHVIGEIQGLSNKLISNKYDNERKRFWSESIQYLGKINLGKINFKEIFVSLDQLGTEKRTAELVGILGPTDTGLIELARREGGRLLTDDEKLLAQAQRFSVDCRMMEHQLR